MWNLNWLELCSHICRVVHIGSCLGLAGFQLCFGIVLRLRRRFKIDVGVDEPVMNPAVSDVMNQRGTALSHHSHTSQPDLGSDNRRPTGILGLM